MKLLSIIKLIRPHQWVKNAVVFLPEFFGGRILDVDCLRHGFEMFIAFSLASSAVYCLNDLKDVESDRLHPIKRSRPIASGAVSPVQSVMLMCVLALASLIVVYESTDVNRNRVFAVVAIYLLINVAYCLKLKHYALIDIFIVSFGFVLRLFAGGLSCDIWLSPWIVCLTFLLALFLSVAKRRDDVVLMDEKGVIARKHIVRYNLPFMNQAMGIVGSVTIVCYIMYTVSPDVVERLGSEYVYVTSVFVLAGVLRYLQVSIVDRHSGSPTKVLLRDRFIQCCLLCWILMFLVIIYV